MGAMDTEMGVERDAADAVAAVQPEFDVFAGGCPSRPTLEHITGRWGVLTLSGLQACPLRFNELRRRIDGVSQKMLAQTLHELERDGFVHREVLGTFPPHVEYSLTPLGAQTAAKLLDLIGHLESHMPAVLAAQHSYDRERPAAGT
jgi:DNA-binding HxlR family transcriptional regulator